jgi:exosortase
MSLLNITSIKKFTTPIIIIAMALIIGILFPATSNTFINTWSKFDEALGHGFLIVALVAFTLLQSDQFYKKPFSTKSLWLLIPIFTLVIIHEISSFGGILVFQQFSLYFLWLAFIAFVFGYKSLKHFAFPIFFFSLAIPFWELLNPLFLSITTIVTTAILELTPIIAFIDGNRIEIPYGIIEISNGCSGLKYFEIALAMSIFAVHKENLSFRLKVFVVIIGVILGIITNWIRVLGLIIIGYETKMTSSLMADHELYGFVLFILVLAPLIILINWLSKRFQLPEIKTDTTTGSICTPFSKAIFLPIILVICVVLLTSKLLATSPQYNKKYVNHTNKTHPMLSDNGMYHQETFKITVGNGSCHSVVRSYLLNAKGENILPYNNIYNSKTYKLQSKKHSTINYGNSVIETIKLKLIDKKTGRIEELHYWYEYKELQLTNKYITKLFELIYIINNNTSMKMNVVSCTSDI